jgi:hypothetical protein
MLIVILNFFLLHISYGAITISSDNSYLQYEGRYKISSNGLIDFDSPGFRINLGIEGATNVDMLLTSNGVDKPHRFWIYIDNVLSDIVIDTKNATVNTVTTYHIADSLSKDYHMISIVKITEADWNNPNPTVNYLSFSGFVLDQGYSAPLPVLSSRTIEFIGDSITAGYCNLCKDNISVSGDYALESFASSWPSLVANNLKATIHTTGKVSKVIYVSQ